MMKSSAFLDRRRSLLLQRRMLTRLGGEIWHGPSPLYCCLLVVQQIKELLLLIADLSAAIALRMSQSKVGVRGRKVSAKFVLVPMYLTW